MVALLLECAFTSQSAQWQREEKTDPLRGTNYSQFTLTGKFLAPPRLSSDAPLFVLKCMPTQPHRANGGYKNGKFLDAYIAVHTVVDSQGGRAYPKYRLDDGKVHEESWSVGTGGTAIFPGETGVNTLLYGHFLPHKERTNPPVQKAVFAVNEYLGAEIVVQFDIPDPSEVADACGLLIHRK